MFSSMPCSTIGRVITVAALAATATALAVALAPQPASAFVMGVGSGGMMSGGGNQNYGAGFGGHVPGYFGSDYGGGSRATGGHRVTQGGSGGRRQPRGGLAGRDGPRGGFAKRRDGRDFSKGAGRAVAAHPATSLGRPPAAARAPQTPAVAASGQPHPVPSFKGTGPRTPARRFGRLGPAGGSPGQPAIAPPVVYQAPAPAPVAANPASVDRPPVYQPPAAAAPATPVAANPTPAYPTYQPIAPVGRTPPQAAPQAFVAKAPAATPVEAAPAACPSGSYVTVAFQANVTTEDVKTFLTAYNVAIAAGPAADGTYTIQLSACPLTPAEMTQVVDSMRSQTAIIARVGA